MKVLIIVPNMDFRIKAGATPVWWQYCKSLADKGVEIILYVWEGVCVNSFWWRTYQGNSLVSLATRAYFKKSVGSQQAKTLLTELVTKNLSSILRTEKDVSAILIFSVSVDLFGGILPKLKADFNLPLLFFEADLPAILPKYNSYGSRVNPYAKADLSIFDAFIVTSEGCVKEVERLGAKNVNVIHFAVDPEFFKPLPFSKEVDIAFHGVGDRYREDWMKHLISVPSCQLAHRKFAVSGTGFKIDLGRATVSKNLDFQNFRLTSCRSKINLSIVRSPFRDVYASSISRPFELASLGCCIVSTPQMGLENWFDVNKELLIVSDPKEVVELYETLLESPDERACMGNAARERILKEHTYWHRTEQLFALIKRLIAT